MPNSDSAGSKGFISFGDLAAQITGLCPAGVAVLANAADVSTSTMINAARGDGWRNRGQAHDQADLPPEL